MYVNPETIEEMKELVQSGDLSLMERRQVFKDKTGQTMPLSENDLLAAIAATDDDDDDLFVTNVKHIAEHGYVTVPDSAT